MPRTREQYNEIREKSRQRIMNAALELFANKGFHHTSITMIAEKAGVSTGLMYNYFESKQALLEAIILEGFQEIAEGMVNKSFQEQEPSSRLRKLFELYFISIQKNIEFWRLYFRLIMQFDSVETVQEKSREIFQHIFKILEDHFREAGSTDPLADAAILAGIFDGVGLHYMLSPDHYPLEAVKEMLIQKYCQ